MLALLAAEMASASSGFLAGNSCRGKNTLEGTFCRTSASISAEKCRGCGDFCHEEAADSVVAPTTGEVVLQTRSLRQIRTLAEQGSLNVSQETLDGAFNLNVWLYSLVEAWAWAKPAGELVDRAASPWDEEERRPSHADKRKALQREIVHQEIQACLCGRPNKQRFRELAERLLQLAA